MKKIFLFVILITSSFSLLRSQTFYHPTVGVQNSFTGTCMSTTCSATYYDDGGSGGDCTFSDIFGNYSDNINGVLRTFCPSTPGTVVQVTFPTFCIEGATGCPYEYFQLIDGPTQNGTVLAAGCGTGFQGLTFVSTHPSGCLTFRFWSDGIYNYTGWQANITCVTPPSGSGPGPSSTSNADCVNSTGICSNGYSFSGLSTGPGLTSDGCNGCVTSENFSNWYEFTIATSGTLGFNINPTPSTCDYDYSLYQSNSCSSLNSPVRCSYAATTGTTGLGNSALDNTEDVAGDGWTSMLNVTAGQHYYLLINEWTPNNGSFNFTWTGTATIQTPIPDFSIGGTIYSSGSTYNVCQNAALTINAIGAGGSTFTWWTAATGGTQLATGSSYSPSTSTVGSTTYYLQETTASGCVSARSAITITVVATPSVNSITSQTLCAGQQTTAVTFAGTATNYNWSNSNTAIGLGANGSGNIPSFTATNSTSSNITGTITVTPVSGTCSGSTKTFTYTIKPTPTMTTPTSQTLCAGQSTTAITFSGTSGATYAWSNNNTATGLGASGSGNIASFTATNSTGAAITSTITVTPTLGTCPGSPVTFSITVNAAPTVNNITSQTVCAGQQTTAVTFAGTATSYNWSNSNTTIGLGASGSGNIAAFSATNSTSAAITGTITVTPISGSCSGSTKTFTITVNPTPTMTTPTSQTLCAGQSTTAITFSGTSGATYAWSNNNTATGLGASGSGNIASFTATNSTGASITSTITVTPTLGTCPGSPVTFSITVNPAPTVNNITSQTVCAGQQTTAVTFAGTATSYNWSNSNTTIGLGASGSGNIAAFSATNSTSAAITGTITVTPISGSCSGSTKIFTITVNPTPTMTTPTSQTLCAGQSTTAITFSGTSGATYAWSNNNTATGLGASGSGNIASFTSTNSIGSAITSTITVTPTIGTCPGSPVTFSITVNPAPTVNNITSQTVCAGQQTTAVTIAGTATSYNWSNSNTTIGLGASGSGNIAAFTATNSTSSTITGTITVTPVSGSCSGTPVTFTITVNPTPTMTTPTSQTLCAGQSTTAITFSGTSGATYAWSNNNTATGLGASGSGNIATFTATNSTGAAITSTITVTPSIGTCPGSPVTFSITVNPAPTVNIITSQTLCGGQQTTAITFTGIATTYSWSNDNVSIGLAATGNGNITSFTPTNATASPITATITVTPNNAICSGTPETFTITVNPTPTMTTPSDQNLCAGQATTTVTFVGTTGTSYDWTNDNTATGLGATGNGDIPSFTTTNSTAASITSTITVTPSIGTCLGTPSTFAITVGNIPSVDPITSQTLCAGQQTTAVTFTGTATTYSWSNDDASIGLAATGNGNIAAFTTTNATASPITATITVTPNNATCSGTPETFTITVNPTPTITTPSDQNLCAGQATTTVTFVGTAGTTYDWTNDNTSTGLGATGNGDIPSFTTTNTTTASITSTITVTPSIGTCLGTPATFTITVGNIPSVDPITSQTLCTGQQTTAVTFTGTATSYNWSNSITTIGLGASGSGNITSFTATNSTAATITGTITVTPNNATCSGTPETFTITVNPTPTMTTPSDQNLCAGQATTTVTFVGTAGTTYDWTNDNTSTGLGATGNGDIPSFTTTNTTTASITSTITVTPSIGTCLGTPATFTITVGNIPSLDPITSQTLCAGQQTTAVTFTGTATTYSWSNDDASIGLAATGNGNIASFTPTNATTSPITATITVTPNNATCSGTPETFTITVNPTPTMTTPSDQNLCAGQATTAVTFVGTTGTSYDWTNDNTSTGLGATGNGDIPSFTTTNSTAASITSTITVTPSIGTCLGTPATFTITVGNIPSVDPITSQTLCAGQQTTALTFTGTATTYSWSNDDVSIGLAATGNGNIASFTPTNATSSPITATITVTPNNATCSGTPETFTITVNPTPTMTTPSNQNLCAGQATTTVTFVGTTGTSYDWTNDNTATGLGATGNGDIPSFTTTNTTAASITSTITVTPSIGTCLGTPATFTITVGNIPSVDPITSQTLCAGQQTTALTFTGTATTYSWSNDDASIGLAATGNGNIASFTPTNATSSPITATITVTPNNATCSGTPETFTITVNPTPTMTTPSNQNLCAGQATTTVTFVGTTGTSYDWTNDNTSTGLGATGNGDIPSFTTTNTTAASITSTITVTPSIGTCLGTPATFTITVGNIPSVDPITSQTLCAGQQTTTVTFTGTATTYSWSNDDASIGLAATGNGNIASFTPTNATASPITATITVTPNNATCSGTPETFTITVNPTPTMTTPSDQNLCAGQATTAVTFVGTTGTSYDWTNDNTSTGLGATGNGDIPSFTTTNTTAASITSTITVTPSIGTCLGTPATFTITVGNIPSVDPITSQSLCAGQQTTAVTFTGTATTYSWSNDDASIGLAATGNGSIGTFTATNSTSSPIIATITVTPNNATCSGTPETFTITVNPTPTMTTPSDQNLCAGQATTTVTFVGTAGTSYDWTNDNTATGLGATGNGDIPSFTTTNTTTASITSTITVTPSIGTCLGTPATFTITVGNIPSVDPITSQTLCAGQQTTAVTFTGTATTYSWSNDDASIGLAASGNGNIAAFTTTNATANPIIATITVTPVSGICSGTSETFTITVNPTTTTTFSQIGPLCINSTAPTLPTTSTNTPAINGTWNPTTITTSTVGTQTFTFTPTAGVCATIATMNIAIDSAVTPTFAQIGPFCQNSVAPSLPTSSTNTPAISGTWSPATISTSTVGTQTYTFTPTNNACTNNATISITINSPTTPTFTQVGPYCQNAIASALPTSSTNSPSITGTWSPVSISTSTVGTATYTFTPGANQCASNTTMSVTTNAIPTITLNGQTVCSGQNVTLTPTVSPTGGTYTWSSAQTTSSITITPTITGTYTVTYTTNGCSANTTSTVTVNPNVTTNFTQLGPYCQNTTAGTLPTTSTNGISGTWNPTNISTTTAGNQNYTFTPTAGTCATTSTMNIVITPSVTSTFNSINTLCQNSIAPILPVSSTNTPSISGTWSPSTINTSSPGSTVYTFTPSAGICATTATLNVDVIAIPIPTFTTNYAGGCAPLSVTLTAGTVPNANYTWTSNGITIGNGATLNTSFTNSGCYDISLNVSVGGCSGNTLTNDFICVEAPPTSSFTVNPVTFTSSNQTATFSNSSVGASSYSWNFGDGSTSNVENPTHVYSNITENILVTLTSTSATGCSSVSTVVINVKNQPVFYVPNSFTPDDDEFNETWGPVFTKGFDAFNFNLLIFNRWGEVVWESHDADARWDGSFGVDGLDCPVGVYVWKIDFKPIETDEKITITGTINLIR